MSNKVIKTSKSTNKSNKTNIILSNLIENQYKDFIENSDDKNKNEILEKIENIEYSNNF